MSNIQDRSGAGAATTPQAPQAPARSAVRGRLAVAAVTLGIFTVMTAELLPVGLLTPVGRDLGVSAGTAGLMVTVPGLVAAVSAPLLAVAAGRADRRLVLAGLMALVVAAHAASALAGHFAVVLGARVLLGVSIGGFWAFAGGLALRLVPEREVPRATAVIFGGVSAASVLGVPAGTLTGELGGWRVAFAVVGALALAVIAALVLLLPPLPAERGLRPADLARLPRESAAVRAGLALTVLLVTGHFLAYTFVRPVLQERHGIGDGLVGVLLLGYGAAGLAGNFLAGAAAARNPRRIVLAVATGLAAALAATALLPALPGPAGSAAGGGAVPAVLLLGGWGLAYGGVSVGLQSWFLAAAPQAAEAATSLYVAAFCLSIAAGAALGGVLVDAVALGAAPAAGAGLTLAAVVLCTRTTRIPPAAAPAAGPAGTP
ncbi:MFS transporter [Streptomyces sp. NPDC004134]|uniref:MFS transporter n=1 Tax=Streptomyces sp. NPDC004134 TaxID=3364691 RepID=UPI00368A5944